MKAEQDLPSISSLPSEVQQLIISHLDAASMFCLLATCHQYKSIISADCQDIWKKHHDARWKYGKLRPKRFRDEIMEWSRENGWAAHRNSPAPQIDQVEGASDWFAEYLYRSKVDMTVYPYLSELSSGNQRSNTIWLELVRHGEDIVDRVLAIMSGKIVDKDLISVTTQGEDDMSDQIIGTLIGQLMTAKDSAMRPCHKFYWGIGRYLAYQEWRFIHESGVDRVIEDGAIAIAKFYQRQDHEAVYAQLDELAHWLK